MIKKRIVDEGGFQIWKRYNHHKYLSVVSHNPDGHEEPTQYSCIVVESEEYVDDDFLHYIFIYPNEFN